MVRVTCRDPFVRIRGNNNCSGNDAAALKQTIRAAVVAETILIILSLSTHSLWSVLEMLVYLPPMVFYTRETAAVVWASQNAAIKWLATTPYTFIF
jgi:hypothetical protein